MPLTLDSEEQSRLSELIAKCFEKELLRVQLSKWYPDEVGELNLEGAPEVYAFAVVRWAAQRGFEVGLTQRLQAVRLLTGR